jgi:glycosyltransferase involved in cell wall biosynthesis
VTPKVSICLPTFNRAGPLRHTLEALLGQTYPDFELVVCDDASTDDTADVVRSFGDRRIRYARNPANLGLYPNWHCGLELAQGELIAIYHDHDMYLPTIVERSVALLDRYPTAGFVHSAHLWINDGDEPIGLDIREFPELMTGARLRRLLTGAWASPVMAATAMVRREAYRRVGLYRHEDYGRGCDLDMWFRLAQVGDVAYEREPQVAVRERVRHQATAQFSWAQEKAMLRMRRDHLGIALDGGLFRSRVVRRWHLAGNDVYLVATVLRAILLEPPEVAGEGRIIASQEGALWVRAIVGVVGRSSALQAALRRSVLPIHYRSVRRLQERQRLAAIAFVRARPTLDAALRRAATGG